ncbi:class F sortase [Streptomyces sp. YIM 98790]|uniref:class F sortase n=1 Tax=Streptomyces sp. YIM 98790 TaxID=2689077 RepID=UPI00140C1CCD|nr:class F sortase [Streptomyces sp. YIM 98790]
MPRAEPPAPGRDAPGRLLPVLAWSVLLLGLWLWAGDLTGGRPLPGGTTGGGAVRLESGALLPPPARPLAGDSPPALLEIPSAGIRAEVVPRGLDAAGAVDPPPYEVPDVAGWYADGPVPGAAGTALLVGHVDTETEPAVFHGLSTVRPGSEVTVTRQDGSTAEFTVERVDVVERQDFDPGLVYGSPDTEHAELRLITCGGSFDPVEDSYSANVVVSAYLTG